MLGGILKAFAYLYVAVALAPLAVFSVALGYYAAQGGDLFSRGPWAVIGPQTLSDTDAETIKAEVTFRQSPMSLAKDDARGAPYAMGVEQVNVSPASSPVYPTDTYYVTVSEVELIGSYGGRPGQFGNVLVQDGKSPAYRKVFDRRMSIKYFGPVDLPAAPTRGLLILAADEDTNNDGKLDATDLHRLFVYAPGDAAPREVTGLPKGSVTRFDELSEPGSLLVTVTLDRNGDGSVTRPTGTYVGRWAGEPQRLYRIDLKALAAAPVIPQPLIDELQKALDTKP